MQVLTGTLAVIILTLQYLTAHQLNPTYDMSNIGLWYDKNNGAFLVALKHMKTDTTVLFGIDGTVKPTIECTEVAEINMSFALLADNFEVILNILKSHYQTLDWYSFMPALSILEASSLKLLPFEFWSSIGSLGCLQALLTLTDRSRIIDMIYYLDDLGIDTSLFCLKAADAGSAHGPAGESLRISGQVLFLIKRPEMLISHKVLEPFYLHTKLFDDMELVKKGQPLYLYQK